MVAVCYVAASRAWRFMFLDEVGFRGAHDDTLWDVASHKHACFENRLLSCLCLAMHTGCRRADGNVPQDCLMSGAAFCSNLRHALPCRH